MFTRLTVSVIRSDIIEIPSNKDYADDNFCFGWVQDSPRNTIVGEARCAKEAGQEMKSFLSSLTNETLAYREKQYDDTMIRLHFTHFKILSPRRNTCFHEEPHKCSHFYFQGEDGTNFRDR